MKLKSLKPCKLLKPARYIIYGQEGAGKTTLCSGAKDPIYIDLEGGAGSIELTRIPFKEGHATDMDEIWSSLEAILEQDHGFKTLILDTLDRLEQLIWDDVCKKASYNVKSMGDFDFGKGYLFALTQWKRIACKLDQIRQRRGMAIVLIGHSHIRTFKNPEGDDYDRYQLRLNEKAGNFLKEWSDVCGFMRFDEGAAKMKGEVRAKGYSTGKRYIHTKRTAAFDAKTRLPLPDEIEIQGPESWVRLDVPTLPATKKKTKKKTSNTTTEQAMNNPF